VVSESVADTPPRRSPPPTRAVPLSWAVVTGPMKFLERTMVAFLRRVSGWTAIFIAAIFYPVIGLVLPLAIHAQVFWLIYLNVFGGVFCALTLLVWLLIRIAAGQRRNLLEWTSNLRQLNYREFEWLVGEVLRREGWTVREMSRDGIPDGNIDLELVRDGRRAIAQCKRWTANSVDVNEIRTFLGTLMREKLPANAGFFVTLSDFTEQARREGREAGIMLLDGPELFSRIEKVRRPELCPKCQAPMLLAKSPHGWWFRCKVNGCGGKRDLGRDPAKVVELLNDPCPWP